MAPKEASLSRPSWRYQSSYISAVYEYIEENRERSWHPDILRDRFDEYLLVVRQAETDPLAGMVPATQYWLILDPIGYIGELALRHRLNESLLGYGGHIGYKIRPSQRSKGFGKLICQFGIEKARQRGIGDILITCDDDNVASGKIIESNGGVLVDRVDNNRGVLTRRYWVFCKRRDC